MCGILGQISFKNTQQWNIVKFEKSLSLQKHRGPDDKGIYTDDRVILGHRRLSIIDLDSHAKQPMISKCKNFVIVFNGEIYNYQEIKEQLKQKGYSFHTKSDTEVLLNAFIEYGIDAVKQFIGMFAFAIYDKKNAKVYIVRDRLGIKPLYYYQDENNFTFSSEIKSILALNDIERKIDLDAVSSYFSFRYPILDNTFFDGLLSLPPAHYIELTNHSLKIKEYWNVSNQFLEQQNDKGEEFYIKELKKILESSVKYRMISDVPFGSFLSGGVDSSVITAIMAKSSNTPIKTFTIGFEEEGYNEFDFAKMIADRYHTEHREILISGENYIDTMEHLIDYKDAPLSVPNEVPLYLMSKELKKYITVVLSGEGADEIFGGYGRIFRSPYDYERMKHIDEVDWTEQEKEEFCINFIRKYGVMCFQHEVDHFINIYSYTSLKEKKELLDETIDLDGIEKKFIEKFLRYFNELKNESYYNRLMYTFEKIHIVGLLQRVDMTTMATSVEARVPFVDHRVVEFAFTIPLKYKLKWKSEEDKFMSKLLMSDKISEVHDTPKYILKKAYEDMIPTEVLYRKKMGFPVPLNNWFGGHFNEYAKNILLDDKARKRGLYNIKNIKKWLNSDRLGKDHSFAMKIWMLINLELFCRKYFDENHFGSN
ncbi:asparagine synthase (glutamine-hydrolyzing) [Hydrogenimonas sp. SS33]|uniref:asparagine synthase (glutamine-hydrolyzing) n=1 Tax=Hydrogenimonas leucolamina TaxID=2954236 RepID=UPI00336C20BE